MVISLNEFVSTLMTLTEQLQLLVRQAETAEEKRLAAAAQDAFRAGLRATAYDRTELAQQLFATCQNFLAEYAVYQTS